MYVSGQRRAVAYAPHGFVNRDHDIEALRKYGCARYFCEPSIHGLRSQSSTRPRGGFSDRFGHKDAQKRKNSFSKTIFWKDSANGARAFARAHTSGTMRTKQTRRAGGAGTRPNSDGMPYVNPLHLIGACRAAKTSPGRTNDGALFRAEAWRRDARRAAVRGRLTRSRASDEIRERVAANSATASAPARGNARERTPTLASSCRVASRQNIFSRGKSRESDTAARGVGRA